MYDSMVNWAKANLALSGKSTSFNISILCLDCCIKLLQTSTPISMLLANLIPEEANSCDFRAAVSYAPSMEFLLSLIDWLEAPPSNNIFCGTNCLNALGTDLGLNTVDSVVV